MRLLDRVAVITGGASGIGRAIADRFAEEGARVVIADLSAEAGARAADEINGAASRGSAVHYVVDVSARDQVQHFAAAVQERFGRIDVLINNAGVTRYRPFLDATSDDWNAVLDVDLKGVFFCAQAVAPAMVRQSYGKIVNIASVSGTGCSAHAAGGSPGGNAAYASAKAGVIQLTKTLARELGPSGVNVNCVAPGFFLTPLTGSTRTPEQVREHVAARAGMAVLNRPGKVIELANSVLFLASDESSFIAGQTLFVDGGRTDRM